MLEAYSQYVQKLTEAVNFRVCSIKTRCMDGYGDPRSLENFLDCVVKDEIRYLVPFREEMRRLNKKDPAWKDANIQQMLRDYDALAKLYVETKAFLATKPCNPSRVVKDIGHFELVGGCE